MIFPFHPHEKDQKILIPKYLFHFHILSSFYCALQMLYASVVAVDNSVKYGRDRIKKKKKKKERKRKINPNE